MHRFIPPERSLVQVRYLIGSHPVLVIRFNTCEFESWKANMGVYEQILRDMKAPCLFGVQVEAVGPCRVRGWRSGSKSGRMPLLKPDRVKVIKQEAAPKPQNGGCDG